VARDLGIREITWTGAKSKRMIDASTPALVRDTAKTHKLVQHLFERGTLVVGLTYPVVPRGDETIRFQLNAAHTKADIDEALEALAAFRG
jgi:glycine C-acetyltransferase